MMSQCLSSKTQSLSFLRTKAVSCKTTGQPTLKTSDPRLRSKNRLSKRRPALNEQVMGNSQPLLSQRNKKRKKQLPQQKHLNLLKILPSNLIRKFRKAMGNAITSSAVGIAALRVQVFLTRKNSKKLTSPGLRSAKRYPYISQRTKRRRVNNKMQTTKIQLWKLLRWRKTKMSR